MKRLFNIFLSLLIAASCIFSAGSSADQPVDMSGLKAAILVESSSQQVILEHNSAASVDVAGLSRLPLLMVLCEAVDKGELNLDSTVSVSEEASRVKGPTSFIEGGEQISARDLMKSAIMIGAGDSIYALCELYSGSDSAFCGRVNSRMQELDINVNYTTCAETGVVLSASDLMKVGCELIKSSCFKEYSSVYLDKLVHANGTETQLASPNKLLKSYSGCDGIATGSSESAGYCGVFSVERGGTRLVGVVLGAASASERFETAGKLFDYGFGSFKSVTLVKKDEVVASDVAIAGGDEKSVSLISSKDIILLLQQNEAPPQKVLDVPETIPAPFSQGDVLGYLKIVDSTGTELLKVELLADKTVDEASFKDFFIRILIEWLS